MHSRRRVSRSAAFLVLVAALAFAAEAQAQWSAEVALTATGSPDWGAGIATSGDTVHVVSGTSDINYRRSLDQGATWSAPRRLGTGVLHLTDAMVADGDDV